MIAAQTGLDGHIGTCAGGKHMDITQTFNKCVHNYYEYR